METVLASPKTLYNAVMSPFLITTPDLRSTKIVQRMFDRNAAVRATAYRDFSERQSTLPTSFSPYEAFFQNSRLPRYGGHVPLSQKKKTSGPIHVFCPAPSPITINSLQKVYAPDQKQEQTGDHVCKSFLRLL
jgi:hypothetical protein